VLDESPEDTRLSGWLYYGYSASWGTGGLTSLTTWLDGRLSCGAEPRHAPRAMSPTEGAQGNAEFWPTLVGAPDHWAGAIAEVAEALAALG